MSHAWVAAARPVGAVALAGVAAMAGAVGGIAAGDTMRQPGAAYLAIATAGNARLDIDFDRLHGLDRGDVAAARNDLRDIAGTERLFDEQLAALPLPPAPEHWARELIRVNEARAALTSQAVASSTPAELAGYQQRLTDADVPVEQAVRGIRAELGLPPPETD